MSDQEDSDWGSDEEKTPRRPKSDAKRNTLTTLTSLASPNAAVRAPTLSFLPVMSPSISSTPPAASTGRPSLVAALPSSMSSPAPFTTTLPSNPSTSSPFPAPASISQTAAPVAAPSSAAPVDLSQRVALWVPVQLFFVEKYPQRQNGVVGAATLIFDPKQNQWSVLCCDQSKRPMILEVISFKSSIAPLKKRKEKVKDKDKDKDKSSSRLAVLCAPCRFEVLEGAFVALLDAREQKWNLQFRTRHEAFRFLVFLAIAVAKTREREPSFATCLGLVDSVAGHTKAIKPKHYAHVSVRMWCLPNVTLSSWSQLEGFDPDVEPVSSGLVVASAEPPGPKGRACDDTVDLPDVRVDDPGEDVRVPQSLGELVFKMKIGGQRIAVLMGNSPLARSISPKWESLSNGGLVVAEIQVVGPSAKKKHHKKDKADKDKKDKAKDGAKHAAAADDADEEEESANALPPAAAPPPPPVASVLPSFSTPSASSTPLPSFGISSAASVYLPASSSSPAVNSLPAAADFTQSVDSGSSKASSALLPDFGVASHLTASANSSSTVSLVMIRTSTDSIMRALQAASLNVSSMSDTQSKLLKYLMGEMYKSCNTDLDTIGMDPAVRLRVDDVLRNHMKGVVSAYVSKNGDDSTVVEPSVVGTLCTIRHTHQTLASVIQPLCAPGVLDQLTAPPPQPDTRAFTTEIDKLTKERDKLLRELATEREKSKKAQQELTALGDRQLKLAAANVEMEEKVKKSEKEHAEMKERTQMLPVFEKGVSEMRSMLENEIAEKSKAMDALADLSGLHRKMKLTWVPSDSQTSCLRCAEGFSMFGKKSKNYCRYCGRLFCRDCTITTTVPEFGFREKVVVCISCQEFRQKQAGADLGDLK